jgi:sulfonate transport system permease protein
MSVVGYSTLSHDGHGGMLETRPRRVGRRPRSAEMMAKTVEVDRAFRLSGFALVRRILLPAIMPAYVLSLRAGLGLGWMFLVAAEFLDASSGLRFLLIDGQQLCKPVQIAAAIMAIAILGKFLDWPVV